MLFRSALLAVLMLRGPQTAGELRINCDRLHRFADISAVEAFLHELAARPAGPLVVELARSPGTRETRWAHLLSGTPPDEVATSEKTASAAVESSDVADLRQTLTALQDEVAALKSTVAALCAEVGISSPPNTD